MQIPPSSMTGADALAPSDYYDDSDPAAAQEAGVPRLPDAADGLAGELQAGVSGLEQRFMSFTQMLSRELSSLERQLSGVLRSLIGSARNSAPDQAPVAKPQTKNPSPNAAQTAAAPPYDGIIDAAAQRNGLDPALVGAVIAQESDYRADAVSTAGAMGLMQLMPDTAHELGVADPFDAAENVEGGARLLRSLLDRYNGRLDLALAAYNAGPAAVDRFGGIPPYAETQRYVSAIMSRYRAAVLQSG